MSGRPPVLAARPASPRRPPTRPTYGPRYTPPPSARAIRRRLLVLGAAFFVMFGAVAVRLADVQVLHPDRYVLQGVKQRFVSKTLPAGRGAILDRNGLELALSLPQKSVFADPDLGVRENVHAGRQV